MLDVGWMEESLGCGCGGDGDGDGRDGSKTTREVFSECSNVQRTKQLE